MSEDLPVVSVIVPVFNDQEGIDKCLCSLLRQSYPRERYEIIVVDNGSDPPVRLPKSSGTHVSLLREGRPGSYVARNCGIRAAKGEILAFTDADVVVASDWLERAVDHLRRKDGISVIGGRIEMFFAHPGSPTPAELYEHAVPPFQQQYFVECLGFSTTANLIVKRSALEVVGYFDEDVFSGGDVRWGLKAQAAGYAIVYCDDVVVFHPARRSSKEVIRKCRRVIAGMISGMTLAEKARYFAGRVKVLPRHVFVIITGTDMGLKDRIRVAALAAVVRLAELMEIVRVSAGRGPVR